VRKNRRFVTCVGRARLISSDPGAPGWNVRMWALFFSFTITWVVVALFIAVDKLEPNRWYALVLKLVVLVAGAIAIAIQMLP
jgi:hypothetical protein